MGGVVLTWHSYIPESRCWGKRICKKIEYLKLASVKIINHNIIIDIYLFIITKDGKQSVAFVWQTFSLMAWKDKQRTIDPYKYPPGYIIWGRRNPYFRHRGRLYIYILWKNLKRWICISWNFQSTLKIRNRWLYRFECEKSFVKIFIHLKSQSA